MSLDTWAVELTSSQHGVSFVLAVVFFQRKRQQQVSDQHESADVQ